MSYMWDRKYYFIIKEIDGDYHELYEIDTKLKRLHFLIEEEN